MPAIPGMRAMWPKRIAPRLFTSLGRFYRDNKKAADGRLFYQ